MLKLNTCSLSKKYKKSIMGKIPRNISKWFKTNNFLSSIGRESLSISGRYGRTLYYL
jgi:hypothetical protein